jgi:hypothetical protein
MGGRRTARGEPNRRSRVVGSHRGPPLRGPHLKSYPPTLIPHPSSLIPHPSPLIPQPSSLNPHPSPLIPQPQPQPQPSPRSGDSSLTPPCKSSHAHAPGRSPCP